MYPWLLIVAVVLLKSSTQDNLGFYEYIKDTDGWLKLHLVPVTWQQARIKCQVEGATLRNVSLKWAKDEPNNLHDKEECVALSGAAELADIDCDSLHAFFCFIDNARMCDIRNKEYLMNPHTGSCYKVHPKRRTWMSAALTCSHEGGYLAIVNSHTEAKTIADMFVGITDSSKMFVGVWDEFHNAAWKTIKGETDIGQWGPSQPNGPNINFCGAIDVKGLLYDYPCTAEFPFICEIDKIDVPISLFKA